MHHDNRVDVEPFPAVEDRSVEITYNGLLQESGADQCWLHYGFDGWEGRTTKRMSQLPDGTFRAAIIADGDREINFCFKDSANNWDNNSGQDWNVEIKPAYL